MHRQNNPQMTLNFPKKHYFVWIPKSIRNRMPFSIFSFYLLPFIEKSSFCLPLTSLLWTFLHHHHHHHHHHNAILSNPIKGLILFYCLHSFVCLFVLLGICKICLVCCFYCIYRDMPPLFTKFQTFLYCKSWCIKIPLIALVKSLPLQKVSFWASLCLYHHCIPRLNERKWCVVEYYEESMVWLQSCHFFFFNAFSFFVSWPFAFG